MYGKPVFDAELQPCEAEASSNSGYDWANGYGIQERCRAFEESADSYAHLNNTSPDTNIVEIPQLGCRNVHCNENSMTSKFPCSTCDKILNTRSEFNKHEKQHTRPYECLVEGCNKSFSQKQQLDRHSQARHEKMAKYYHCMTEGCKYSCTNRRAKKILREDHIKAHIKQCGHYGPHSPCERERRGKQATLRVTIRIIFEEWKMDDISEKRRTLRTADISSPKTPLYYPDIVDKAYVLKDNIDSNVGFHCDQPGCYFNLEIGKLLPLLAFKSQSDLTVHKRRTIHQPYKQIAGTIYRYPSRIQIDLDLATREIAPSEVENVSQSSRQIESRQQMQPAKEAEEPPESSVPSCSTVDPFTLGNANFSGIESCFGHTSSTDNDLYPWSLGSAYIAQDNESLRTATQQRYETYSETFQPSAISEFGFDTYMLAGTGAWNSSENSGESSWQGRQLTLDSVSDCSSLSTSSSSVFSEAESFSEPAEYLFPTPNLSSTFGFSDLNPDLPDFFSPSLEITEVGAITRQTPTEPSLRQEQTSRENENSIRRWPENIPEASAVSPVLYQSVNVETSTSRTPCPECRKDFARSRDMKRHLKSCHEAVIYKCPEEGCGQEFSRADKFKRHLRERPCS